jgi:hypothetical protein
MSQHDNSIYLLEEVRLKQPTYSNPPTKKTPLVEMDFDNGYFIFKGRSIPKYASSFYYPVMEKIERYLTQPKETTYAIFFFEYLDSSSSRLILSILQRLKKVMEKGYNLQIEWHYLEDDEDIMETGETYEELTGMEFDFVYHVD